MIKKLLKFGLIIMILFGLYKLSEKFPVESLIGLGIVLFLIIFYWMRTSGGVD